MNTSQVTVDPSKPPRLPAGIPDTTEKKDELTRYLLLSGREDIAAALLGANMNEPTPVAHQVQTEMARRAAVVLHKKRAVVDQAFRELSPMLDDVIEDVHLHVAKTMLAQVKSAELAFADAQALPERLQAVLDAAGAGAFHIEIAHQASGKALATISGDTTRVVSSVLCSRKREGLGAQRRADGFAVYFGQHTDLSAGSFPGALARSLKTIADIRRGDNATLLDAFEVADRARIESKLKWIELQAGKGTTNTKYLAEINGWKIDRFPDLQQRLQAALALVSMPADERTATRWIGFIESSAEKGYLYKRGVDELRGADLSRWPELQARYEAAVAKGTRGPAAQWIGYVEEAAATGQLYVNGIKKLGEMDLRPYPDLQQRLTGAIALAAQGEADSDSEADGKVLLPATATVSVAAVMDLPGAGPVYVQRIGKAFPISDSSVRTHGPHLIEHVGQLGRLAYWRHATFDELDAFNQSQEDSGGDAATLHQQTYDRPRA